MALFQIAAIWAISALSPAEAIVLKTTFGDVNGQIQKADNGQPYVAFLGIPYALPPIGQLRFEDPQPVPESPTVLKNLENHPACLQLKPIRDVNNTVEAFLLGEEDCLYLSIYAPMAAYLNKDKQYPVMVFIHGGGYMFGEPPESPSRFTDEDVIVVFVTYRLGPLGFMSTNDQRIKGNFGLKDQRAALAWVQKYITYFNGDPKQVTLCGQSAGAAAVQYHMASPYSKGLFQRAILQSGSLFAPWAASVGDDLRNKTLFTAQNLGCTDSDQLKNCLQNLGAESLVDSQKLFRYWDLDPVTIFVPDFSGETFTESKIPILSGVNSLEGGIKAILLKNASHDKINDFSNNKLDYIRRLMYLDQQTKDVKTFEQIYFKGVQTKKNLIKSLVRFYSDYYFYAPEVVKAICHKGKMFAYLYDYRSRKCDLKDLEAKRLCALHSDELSMLFRDNDRPLLEIEDEFYADYMVKFWTNFIKTGDPTPDEGLIKWKPLEKDFEYLKMTNKGFSMEKNYLKKYWSLTNYVFKFDTSLL